MRSIWKRAAAVMGATVLGAALLTTSFAVAAPRGDTTTYTIEQSHPERSGALAKLEAILTRLVEQGVITQAQKEAILEAVRRAHEHKQDRDPSALSVRRFLGNVIELSSQYLDLPVEAIRGQLGAGKTLGEIAEQRPGKSREGLIDFLRKAALERIQRALDEQKITPEQAQKLRAMVDEAVVRVVDHRFEKKSSR